MAKSCEICSKTLTRGRSFVMKGIAKKQKGIGLHCTGVSKRWFKPNLQRIRIVDNGQHRRAVVCTSCIQRGAIQKV